MEYTEKQIIEAFKRVYAWTCMDVCKYYGLDNEEFMSMANSNDFNIVVEVNNNH